MGEKQTKILRGKHKETSNKYLPVNSNLFVLYYFCLVLVFEARILRALWTMISEDKENMWTSNLLKKSNNDNSAVVVAFASNNNIKQYQTQFKYKISVLHSLLWVSNTQRFKHYKKILIADRSTVPTLKVCICVDISSLFSLELRWYCIHILVHLFSFHCRVQERSIVYYWFSNFLLTVFQYSRLHYTMDMYICLNGANIFICYVAG